MCVCVCLSVSAQKALRGSETETRELLGGTEENTVSPDEGSLICPPGKSTSFHKKETEQKLSQWPDLDILHIIDVCSGARLHDKVLVK